MASGAREVLEYVIKQTTDGDGVSKFTVSMKGAKDGMTDFEKAAMGTRSTLGGLDNDIIAFNTNLGSAADLMSGFGLSIPQSPMALFGQLLREGTDLMWESIQMAGDAEEQVALFEQTFRGESEATRAELEAYGDTVGRSVYSLMDMASGIQTILVPMGMARDVSADWSVKLAQLSTDLGAAFNKDDADVLADIRSGLLGSTEVLEKYGINLKMSALNQELLNMGIDGGVQGATEQEKVLARLNVIMQSTADYQGQAARESDSFNGQMKDLTANAEELQIALGKISMPVIMPYLQDITGAAGAISDLVDKVDELNGGGEALGQTLHDVNQVLNPVYSVLGLIGDIGDQLGEKTLPQIAIGFAEENTVLEPLSRNLQTIYAGYEDLYDLLSNGQLGKHVEDLQEVFTVQDNLRRIQTLYKDMTMEEIAALQDYGEELDGTRQYQDELNEATEEGIDLQQEFQEALSDITSLDTNFSGIVNLATRYDSILEQIGDKQERIAELNAISATGGYIDGVYYTAKGANEEIGKLTGEVEDLQGQMSEMANQVVLDMLMATISMDGVISEAEMNAYFGMAETMGIVSRDAADAAMQAYDEAIAYINGLEWDPKTGELVVNVTYNDPGFTPSSGTIAISGGTVTNSIRHEFKAEGGTVLPGQAIIMNELGPEPVVFDQPATIISNRDYQNGAVGGVNLNFYGPVYMRTKEEIRDVVEEVLVEAARR